MQDHLFRYKVKKNKNRSVNPLTLGNGAILPTDLLQEVIYQSLLHRRGAAEHPRDALQMLGGDLRMCDQEEQQRGNDEEHRGLVLLEAGDVILGRELGHRHEVRAHVHQVVQDRVEAIDVEEGQNGKDGILELVSWVLEVDEGWVYQLRDIRHQITVRQHHTLGDAGRTRAVRQHCDVCGFDRREGHRFRRD